MGERDAARSGGWMGRMDGRMDGYREEGEREWE